MLKWDLLSRPKATNSPSVQQLSEPKPMLWYSGKSNPNPSSPIEWEMSHRSSIRSPHSGLSSRESRNGDRGPKTSPAMAGGVDGRLSGWWGERDEVSLSVATVGKREGEKFR